MKLIADLPAVARRLLPKNKFVHNVSVLAGGTAGAQFLMMLATPILTRLYTPEEFGLLAVYAGLLTMFTIIASLRYESAIPVSADDQEAANLAALCLLIVLGMTLLSIVLVLFMGERIAILLRAPALTGYLWLFPVGVFFVGIYQVFYYWAVRQKTFAIMASTRVKQSLTTIVIQMAAFKWDLAALLVSYVGSQGVGIVELGRSALQRPEFKLVSLAGIASAARRYRRFPLYLTWSGLFNTAGGQLPPVLFAAFFNPAAAGLYSLTNRVLATPMSTIGGAIGKVFYADAPNAYREGRLGDLVSIVHEKLAHIAMPPALVLLIAGPQIFAFVFGESWREAGVFAQWMAPWMYMRLVTSPLGSFFIVLEKPRRDLSFEAIFMAVRLTALIGGGLSGSLLFTVALFSMGSAMCWAGFQIWITAFSGNSIVSLLRPTLIALGWGLLCTLPLALGLLFPQNVNEWLTALVLTGVLVGTRFYFLLRQAY